MIQKQYFDLGCKLIGFYFLAWALISLMYSLTSTILAIGSDSALSGMRGMFYVVTPVGRIFVAIIAACLVKNSSRITRFTLGAEDDAPNTEAADYFTVGVKLYGIILVVGTIPDFIRVASTYLFLAADTPYGTTPTQAEAMGLMSNFFVPMASILFGLLLFFRGDLLSNWAFAERNAVGAKGND